MLERPFLLISNCSTWFPNADSTKAWLEIYRLPKDSWLKEMEKSSGAAAGLAHWRRRRSTAISMVQTSSISHCASFSYTLLPTSLSPRLASADRDSKIQAEQACWPRGLEYMSLQLPIPHFIRPFCYCDMFILPRQTFQRGSLCPRANIPPAAP